MSNQQQLTVVVRFRVTPEDKLRIDEAARTAGLMISSYLRQLVLRACEVDVVSTGPGPALRKGDELRHPKEL